MRAPDRAEAFYDRKAKRMRERFFLSHREVTERQYRKLYPLKRRQAGAPLGQPLKGYPILSDSVGVHPLDAKAHEALAKEDGVPTKFCPRTGRPEFTSLNHQRAYLRTIGFHNNDDNAGGK